MTSIKEKEFKSSAYSTLSEIINHNMGNKPDSIVAIDNNLGIIEPTLITYNSGNQITLTFENQFTGDIILYFNDLIITKGLDEYKVEVNDTDDGVKAIII